MMRSARRPFAVLRELSLLVLFGFGFISLFLSFQKWLRPWADAANANL